MKTLIRGGRVVDPAQGLDTIADLLLDGWQVAAVGPSLDFDEDTEVLDARGKVVTPGLIDCNVHLREPGEEWKETIRTGTLAAAAGGFTAVACGADTVPVNDNRAVTERIRGEAERHGYARVHVVGAASHGMGGESMAEVGEMVAGGIVAVSDDPRPITHAELMRRLLLYTEHFGIPVVQRPHDDDLAGGVMHEGTWSTRLGLPGLPAAAEDAIVARDLLLLEDYGGRLHFAHLSTARALDLVRRAKARGLAVTCDVTPHHLLLEDEAVAASGFDPSFKVMPPLRSSDDRRALLEAIADGTVDAIASDHSPHHPDEKDVQFSTAPFGAIGLETTLAVCHERLVASGPIGLARLIELLSTGPARAYGVPGGSLEVGSLADVTIFDPESTADLSAGTFRSKARNTPFEGWRARGRVVATVLAGRVVEIP